MRDLPRVGVMWGVLYLSIFLVLIVGCDQSNPEESPPRDQYKYFDIEYVRMDNYNAFESSGNYTQYWVGNKFSPCSTWVEFHQTAIGLADTMLETNPYTLIAYVRNNSELSGFSLKYCYHLFAIKSFRNSQGTELIDTAGKTVGADQIAVSFVCVDAIRRRHPAVYTSMRASTVVHELGHGLAALSERCEEGSLHDSPYSCVMAQLREGSGGALESCCGSQGWTWTGEFCDSCKLRIRYATPMQ